MAFLGKGTVLQKDISGSSDFATIGKITELTAPNQSADSVEITHMESPGGFREFMAGLRDAGEVSGTIHLDFNDPVVQELQTDYEDGAAGDYQMVFSDPSQTKWQFRAFLTGLEIQTPMDDVATYSFTFKISGIPTYNA